MPRKMRINNEDVEATKVTIVETVERFSQIRTDDGSIINIKASPQEVFRIDNRYDDQGNPMYFVTSNTVVTIHSSPLSQEEGV